MSARSLNISPVFINLFRQFLPTWLSPGKDQDWYAHPVLSIFIVGESIKFKGCIKHCVEMGYGTARWPCQRVCLNYFT